MWFLSSQQQAVVVCAGGNGQTDLRVVQKGDVFISDPFGFP